MSQLIINGMDVIYKEAYETEHHLHNKEIWFGNGATEDSLTPYTLISGNGAYGTEVLLIDTANTPVEAGKQYFDLHKAMPIALSSATIYYIRFIYGTGTVAAAETARQYTTITMMNTGVGVNAKGSAVSFLMRRVTSGTKVWAKCKNATNLATATILIGFHEYDM